jgi:hypothetical protein
MAQAKLAELKARAKSATADVRIDLSQEEGKLEQGVEAAKAKLHELGEASGDAWEQLKDDAQSTWDKLSTAVSDAVAKLKD